MKNTCCKYQYVCERNCTHCPYTEMSYYYDDNFQGTVEEKIYAKNNTLSICER